LLHSPERSDHPDVGTDTVALLTSGDSDRPHRASGDTATPPASLSPTHHDQAGTHDRQQQEQPAATRARPVLVLAQRAQPARNPHAKAGSSVDQPIEFVKSATSGSGTRWFAPKPADFAFDTEPSEAKARPYRDQQHPELGARATCGG
jgi:hypothetical protein